MNKPKLDILVPCYNEEDVFSYCLTELQGVLNNLITQDMIASHSSITFIDDGSRDMTWNLISEASFQSSSIKGIKLSCNRGHQIALLAGLNESDADIIISIDADLQDDTSVIEKMVRCYLDGYDIVYGVRSDRKTDTGFKRHTAEFFYRTMNWMGVKQIPNHADYRLLSRRALDALLEYKEQNLYIRGLVPLVGFKSNKIFYSRAARLAGESKYPLKKMLGLAVEGITSLTVTPLRTIAALGFGISFFSVFAALYALIEKFSGNTVEGWTSVMIAIFFLGGVQMLSLGVIGEYIGKIYMETKERPKYFIEEKTELSE
ncbi:glycosyltransferase family 2 protein [Pantoea agglomerans]|nr:glycosyltransferase family 2 protein [Pantoea agglomerans]NEG86372.1 glycosyltransferase [Pantoea agglomerans]NEH08319.1 glycosyltransferase [Pantoea agglomerans]TCZ23481.1 glycosyltransferase [Pantoea agglomerans]UOV19739.1 glycosyltransferase family 2 protein [Pantoea agglomerans]